MTDRQYVASRCETAAANKTRAWTYGVGDHEEWVVTSHGYAGVILGQGDTEDEAWACAARKLRGGA